MTAPRLAETAARLLQLEAVDRERAQGGSAADGESQRRGVAAIERALLDAARRRRRARLIGGAVSAVAAAAAVVAGIFVTRDRAVTATAPPRAASGVIATTVTGSVSIAVSGTSRVATPGSLIVTGSQLKVSPGAGAILTLSSGSRLGAEGGCEVSVSEASARHVFVLGAGTVNADVVPLRQGEQFIVRTGDAEVEVRGTSFAVSVVEPSAACSAAATRVDVREGVVVVRHGGREHRVAAGETWPVCPATASPESAPVDRPVPAAREVPDSEGRRASSRGAAKVPPSALAPTQDSALAEQNLAFAKAVELRRAGRPLEAAAAFERFLTTYAKSPLREGAEIEILRAYRGRDDARARVWAKRYLSNHPAGPGRAEAEETLSGGSR